MPKTTAVAAAVDKSRAQATDNTALEKAGNFKETLGAFLEKHKDQIQRALPANVPAERLNRVAMTAVNVNPELQKCTIASIYLSVLQSAQLNLECDGLLGQAWLVPYGNQAKLMIGYQGYIQLIYRGGYVSKIFAMPVYKGDEFSYSYGSKQHLDHIPGPAPHKDENITHFYAFATLKDGSEIFEVKTKEEVDKIRATSKMKDSAPWRLYYSDMGRKTAARALRKWLPQSADQIRAHRVEEAVEVGYDEVQEIEPESIETVASPSPTPDAPPPEIKAPEPPTAQTEPESEAAAPRETLFEEDGSLTGPPPPGTPKYSSTYEELMQRLDRSQTSRDLMALMKEAKAAVDKRLISQTEFKDILTNTNKGLAILKRNKQ